MRQTYNIIFIFLTFLLSAQNLYADKKTDLRSVNETLKKSEIEKNSLDKQVQEISKRLITLKQNEKNIRTDLEYHELKSTLIEKDLWQLEKKNKEIQNNLKKNYPQFNTLLSTLVHKEKTPPQVILAEAKTPESIFLSTITINALIPKIQTQILSFKKQLSSIRENQSKLEKNRKLLSGEHQKLEKKYAALKQNVTEKEVLHKASLNRRKKVGSQIQQLSKKAKSLESLIKAMQDERLMKHQKKTIFSSSKLSHKFIRPLANSEIIESFGQQTQYGTHSKGIKLISSDSNSVMSPYDGTVLFSGPFRQYGNIVIIEHDKGYHSFLAGLESLNTNVGDIVMQGEEVGKLSTNHLKDSVLYFEIRNNNQPLNPTQMI